GQKGSGVCSAGNGVVVARDAARSLADAERLGLQDCRQWSILINGFRGIIMLSKEFTALRRQEPFRPFRVTLTDGRIYDVVHPQLMMVGVDEITIGFPRKGSDQPFFETFTTVALADIRKVDLLE